jgi:hypothetical protein
MADVIYYIGDNIYVILWYEGALVEWIIRKMLGTLIWKLSMILIIVCEMVIDNHVSSYILTSHISFDHGS